MTAIEYLETHRIKGAGCWEWTGTLNTWGYGLVAASGKTHRAHRVAWTGKAGPVPNGMDVLHTCDNRQCTRDDDFGTYYVNGKVVLRVGHLFLGTQADNSADMWAKGRGATGDSAGARTKQEAMPRGETHWNARLNAELVTQIRRAHDDGATEAALAEKFGVKPATIHSVVSYRTWKHVP